MKLRWNQVLNQGLCPSLRIKHLQCIQCMLGTMTVTLALVSVCSAL